MVDPDDTATVGLDRDQARALVAAATGAQALYTAAVVRLLLHNALRVDEASAPTSPASPRAPAVSPLVIAGL